MFARVGLSPRLNWSHHMSASLLAPSCWLRRRQLPREDRAGEFLENQQLEPDHLVENDPESVPKGRDKQLEKAVEVLMAKLRKAT
jgi:hypothetical protein